jgi:hypothetical protein
MRRLSLCLLPAAALSGCSLWPQHDPSQAWIDLAGPEKNTLQAVQVDAKPQDDDDYFQIQPGAHELEVRFSFEVSGSNIGRDSEALPRTCLLTLDYAGFAAGERYRLEAGSFGFRPWAQLYGTDGSKLAQAREGRCGDV